MIKNYSLKSFLAITAISSSLSYGQSLSEVLCNLNANSTDVTALVPSMYTFAYDGGANSISDGGNDMYDGANYLNTNLASAINYSDDIIIADAAFGTSGQYFTRHLPGLFVMAADINGITSFSLSGNNGADGGGSVDAYTFTTVWNGQNYNAFVKRVYNAGDPSINHVILIPENVAVSHTFSTNSNDDQHEVSDLSATTRIYYFLVSSASGGYIDNTTITAITDQFLLSAVGLNTSPVVANATGTDICFGDTLNLFGTGGTGAYTWNLGVTDSVEFVPTVGVYDYIVNSLTGTGCNQTDTITVTVKESLSYTLSTSDEIAGNDGGVYVTLTSGFFPFTYDWNNDGIGDFDDPQNLTGVAAGSYSVTVMQSNGCSVTSSAVVGSQVGVEENQLSVSVYPNPTSDILTIQTNDNFVYQISDMSGKVILTNAANYKEIVSLVGFSSGTYLLTVSSTSGAVTTQIIKN